WKRLDMRLVDGATWILRIKGDTMTTDNIFSGLKVVYFTSFIAGPGSAVILSDFGADVIKVEPPSGDLWRHGNHAPPYPEAKEPHQWPPAHPHKARRTHPMHTAR